ncbi:MAG: nitrilase-related carbon-nitrogen hydrolase [Acidobacteriota bacterium]
MNSAEGSPSPYYALALQATCRAINGLDDVSEARARMGRTLERLHRQIIGSRAFIGSDVRLVVLPEYFLTGYPMGEPIAVWAQKAALDVDGPEYERMAKTCQQLGIYLSGNAYERDAHFPGIYFQTSFLIDDQGEVVLRYRRLNSMYAPTPHDVWDRYLEIYGADSIFPVARTALGNIGAIASEEILYPEVARCLAMRGAEIFLHSTSEAFGDGDTPKDIAKKARAIENLAYVVSANSAGITDTPIPASSADGGSKVIDYRGKIVAAAATGESMTAHAEIDPAAVRRTRRRPGMMNLLARQRFELYAASYAENSFHPPNTMAEGEPDRSLFRRTQEATIRRLEEAGLI